MIRTTVEIDIARPPEEVFAFISDFTNNTRWQDGMRECTFTSDPPLRVGSTYDQVAVFRRREIRSSFVVTALDEGRTVTIETTAGPFPIKVTRSVAPVDGGTRVRADVEGSPGGLLGLLAPIVTRMVRRSVRADYRRLKDLLEGG